MKEFLKEGLAVISVQPKPNDPKELKEDFLEECLKSIQSNLSLMTQMN